MVGRTIATAIGLLLGASSVASFQQVTFLCSTEKKNNFSSSLNANDGNDPTKVWYADIANGIQNILTNSPLNEGKKALVRKLAGDYDVAAVQARLKGLIESSNNGVLMLSFTT
mmetsp:Transcript_10158/g.13214  ORF Transcript_10158/g.13214 Transcript_10158/m.13214 type:complete len:113 (-) Transcript_10158:529-867(-)